MGWVGTESALGTRLAPILKASRAAPGYHEGFPFWTPCAGVLSQLRCSHRDSPIRFRAQTTPTAIGEIRILNAMAVRIAVIMGFLQ